MGGDSPLPTCLFLQLSCSTLRAGFQTRQIKKSLPGRARDTGRLHFSRKLQLVFFFF